jgi:hypothetical protein
MPAPPSALLKSTIIGKMGAETTGSPEFQKFIGSLCDEINKEWTAFITGTKWGKLTIVFFVGAGGKMTSPPFTLDIQAVFTGAGFTVQTDGTKKLLNGLKEALTPRFATWASSFIFAGVIYPVAPPLPLIAVGKGTAPSGIQSEWEGKLKAAPDPIFQLDSPACHTKKLTAAVSSTIEELFASFFLAATLAGGDTGPLNGTSSGTGVIV